MHMQNMRRSTFYLLSFAAILNSGCSSSGYKNSANAQTYADNCNAAISRLLKEPTRQVNASSYISDARLVLQCTEKLKIAPKKGKVAKEAIHRATIISEAPRSELLKILSAPPFLSYRTRDQWARSDNAKLEQKNKKLERSVELLSSCEAPFYVVDSDGGRVIVPSQGL